MVRYIISIAILINSLSLQTLKAQQAKQYYFTHYATESGLLSTEVNTVLQDADGFIWAGSVDGLQRFDGTRFKTFRHNPSDSFSIPNNNILQLLTDKKKNLWLLTSKGDVGIFDTKSLRFRRCVVKVKIPGSLNATIKRLITDEFGNIFLLLGGIDVLTWNEKKNELSYEHNFLTFPAGTSFSDFIQQPGTYNYWIALKDGVAIYNRKTDQISFPADNREKNPVVDLLAKISIPFNFHFDKKGRCWFQSWQPGMPEAYCFDLNSKKATVNRYEFISTLKTYYETSRFFEQEDGTIWITGLDLFAKFIEQEKKFQFIYNGYLNERSISYERLTCLSEDKEHNIWVSTSNNGLYRFNPSEQFFTNIAHSNRNTGNKGRGSIMSFVNTRWGTLLAGSWSDGIYHYDNNLNLLPLAIEGIGEKPGPSAWDMYASGDSITIWVASQPGLYAIDQSKRSASFYNPPVLNNKTIRQVAEDKQGNLWLGMQNFGVFKWSVADKKARKESEIKRFDKIPVGQINKITVDRKGCIWFGTAANGLYVLDPVTNNIILRFGEQESNGYKLPEPGVSDILEYDDSTVLITTSRQVIAYNRYTKRSAIIGKSEMLKGYIAAMERDKKGYVWIATTSGIYRANIRSKVFVRFDRVDGINNDHFTLSASMVAKDGRIFFGSSDQFVAFDPGAIDINKVKSIPRITDFKVMNKSLLVDSLLQLKQTVLRYDNNSLEIEFSPLVYSSGTLIMYKLEGLDKEWKMADKNNQAIYTYLPPKKYTFLMKTIDAEGNISDVITSMKIKVKPPFWKSWWFFSLLAIAIGALLFWFDRERMKRKDAIEKMRSNIADNLHGEVNTALNNINILSEMARLKADKDPEKSKEYIEQIHTKSQNMIIAMDDMLWSLDPGNDSMAKTTTRMLEYIDALKNRYGVNIDIAVDKKVEALELNMKLRHEAFLVFKEGIKNLVTLGANNCHVYISFEKGNLLFTTLFDSDKCDMQQLNNLLHRQDLERRLNMMQAAIDIALHKNTSSISLRVPVS